MRLKKGSVLLLLMPQILLLSLFLFGLANSFVQSLGLLPSLGLNKPTLFYYQDILSEKDFWESLFFSFRVSIVSSVLAVIGGVALCSAMVLRKQSKGKILRIVQIPIMVPHVVVALFVISIFSQSGLLSRIAYHIGLIPSQAAFPDLLFNRDAVGILLAYLWKEIPFVAFFVVTLLSDIDENLGEAARNLGARPFYAFCHVTLPLCVPAIQNAFMIILAFSFGAYELPFLLGATSPKALPVKAYLEYISPDLENRPRAMAMNSILLGISLLMTWIYYRLSQKKSRRRGAGE